MTFGGKPLIFSVSEKEDSNCDHDLKRFRLSVSGKGTRRQLQAAQLNLAVRDNPLSSFAGKKHTKRLSSGKK